MHAPPPDWLAELCSSLGWRGGTIADALAEVKKLADTRAEVGRRLLTLENRLADALGTPGADFEESLKAVQRMTSPVAFHTSEIGAHMDCVDCGGEGVIGRGGPGAHPCTSCDLGRTKQVAWDALW